MQNHFIIKHLLAQRISTVIQAIQQNFDCQSLIDKFKNSKNNKKLEIKVELVNIRFSINHYI